MKHALTAAIALACIPLPLMATSAIDSRIERVTLYPGGIAEIERVAEFTPSADGGTLTLSGLSPELEPDSVSVAVDGDGIRIGGVETSRTPVGEAPAERQRELESEIQALKEQRQTAQDRMAAARSQIRFIEGLAELPQGEGAADALTAGDGGARWASLWQNIGSGSRQAHENLRAAEREAGRLEQRISTLQRRLEQLGQSRREVVRLAVAYRGGSGEARSLRLRYRVSGSSWEPVYEARLDTAEGRLNLVRSARVRQATGSDWRDVTLRLSTTRPIRGDRPQPQPWWIDLAKEESARADKAIGIAPRASSLETARADGGAETVNAEFAATYVVDGPVSVPSDNQARTVRLGSRELEARVGAQVVPQQDTRAWLTAGVTWPGPGPLPAGRVSRFLDGAYVGSGRLATWAPDQKRDLAFGTDSAIDVRFAPTRDEAGESGWITTQSTRARYYRLTLTNGHSRALPVTVVFRTPVARNEAISVSERFDPSPGRRDVDDRRGVHAWDLELEAGAQTALGLGYEVSYPEDRRLEGLR